MFAIRSILMVFFVAMVSACGGGGDGGGGGIASESTPVSNNTYLNELQGVWIFSSDKKYTGSSCLFDARGRAATRTTIKISGNTYETLQEECLIFNFSTGNTGSYIFANKGRGTVNIGDIHINDRTTPSNSLRAIDFIPVPSKTLYTSYRINDGKLYIADPIREFDGSTPTLRLFSIDVSAPYVKQ